MEIGAIIRSRRELLGMTLEDLAKKIGVNKSTISRWETGDIDNMRREKISSLADALKISPMVILGRAEPEPLDPEDIREKAAKIIEMLDQDDIDMILELKDSDDEKAKVKLCAMLINKISQL